MPPAAVRAAARMLGREEDAARLDHSLIVDPAKLIRAGWKPRPATREALAETVRTIVSDQR
jgi:hypothetical protein